jgi:hypothetical protein
MERTSVVAPDPEAIADGVAELLDPPRAVTPEAVRDRVGERFSLARWAERVCDEYAIWLDT